jgi:hypothetical protein
MAMLLVVRVGQDGGETPRTFLDEEGFLPILVQYLQPVGRDPAGGLAGPGGDGMGGAGRGGSARPGGGVGAMEEGGDLLELFGSDLVPHRQSPRVESREHPPASFLCPPRSFDGAGWAVLLIRSAEPAGQGPLATRDVLVGPTRCRRSDQDLSSGGGRRK